jgi:hypothetical protein
MGFPALSKLNEIRESTLHYGVIHYPLREFIKGYALWNRNKSYSKFIILFYQL